MILKTRIEKRSPILAVVLFAIALCAMALLGGCSGQVDSEGSGESISVTDGVGRVVEIPAGLNRIAALDSFASEAVVMCGAGSQLCGCPAGTKSDEILCEIYPGLSEVPVPLSGGTVNIESLAASDPDVVLVKSSLYYSEGETEKLDKMGIPYLVVEYSTMDEQIAALEMIGKVCGGSGEQKMADICDYYRESIERVSACAARVPENERVKVYHAINEIVRTDGAQSLGADWISCVGAIDVSAGEDVAEGETDYTASLEQIYLWDPDVVICNSAGTTDYLMSDSKWQGLRAVQEGEVKSIPVGATRWGQRGSVETFFAMMWLGCTIYPDYYSEIDLKSEVVSFYSDVLGVDVSDEDYAKILSGEGMRAGSSTAAGGAV